MTPRQVYEAKESRLLSEHAALSVDSRGRAKEIALCPLRTCYQRDRDRILHSKAFRRLAHKTQVFLAPRGDHYRTRLTHTLEVSQISRTIARALELNEDLTEAVALGHDLGHTPFGHVGEQTLRASNHLEKPFNHNEQSLRVVELLEYQGQGLNLTWEVRDGILNHTGDNDPSTMESKVVRIADRIAYINHDTDDAVRGSIISESDLPAELVKIFGHHHGLRISAMFRDLIEVSAGLGDVLMSEKGWSLMNELRQFLFDRVYTNSAAKTEDAKQGLVLRSLFNYFCDHPDRLPEEFQATAGSETAVRVTDYVAGMTDRFAIKMYEALFVPKVWDVISEPSASDPTEPLDY